MPQHHHELVINEVEATTKRIERPAKPKNEPTIDEIIKNECSVKGVDKRLVKAIIQVESKGNAGAVGDNGESFGLMQIQPRWHSDRMERLGVTDLLDARQNVKVGVDILSELLEEYNEEEALTIYNAGHLTSDRSYYLRVKEVIENEN